MKIDEFAPHWSAILKDGRLSITFELETTLTDVPDEPLIELLRTAIAKQVGSPVDLSLVVSGRPYAAKDFSVAATVRTLIARVIERVHPAAGRYPEEWELRSSKGAEISHDLTVGAMLANFPSADPYWLSRRAGWGS